MSKAYTTWTCGLAVYFLALMNKSLSSKWISPLSSTGSFSCHFILLHASCSSLSVKFANVLQKRITVCWTWWKPACCNSDFICWRDSWFSSQTCRCAPSHNG
jgi:hypothetical protein